MRLNRVLALGLATAPIIACPSPSNAQQAPAAGSSGRIVVFGDSLSDGGFFLAVDPTLPREAGSFTTNPDPVAPEVLAALLGLDLKPIYGQGGTNYAVGGARVTAANGITVPIATQVSRFLATNPSISPTDLFYIQGGGNDYFAFLAGGGVNPVILTTAAKDLATQVARLQSAGAQRIITLSIQSAGAAPIQSFNAQFKAALASQGSNVLFVDVDKLFNEILANPASFGITNVTGVACTVPSSLRCTRSTLVTPNANETYVLADSVHPAGIVQRIQGQLVASLVQAPNLIANLPYAAQASFRSQRDQLASPIHNGVAGGGIGVFGSLGYHYAGRNGGTQRIGFTERAPIVTLGLDVPIGPAAIGVAGAYSDGKGGFEGQGGYDSKAYSVTGYGRFGLGPGRLTADGTYGRVNYDNLGRSVILGPSLRTSNADTEARYYAARASGSATLLRAGEIGIGPEVSLSYENTRVDGFADDGVLSSDAAFGRQKVESLTGRFGLIADSAATGPVRFLARANYVREFDNDPQTITITPSGAPVSFTTGVLRPDRDYFSGGFAVDGTISGRLSVRGGVSAEVGRSDFDRVAANAGLSLAF